MLNCWPKMAIFGADSRGRGAGGGGKGLVIRYVKCFKKFKYNL